MSTISTTSAGKTLVAVKGAPETIKNMLRKVPEFYDETYKWYTRKGSRVLALGMKEMEVMSSEKVCQISLTYSKKFTIGPLDQ